MWTSTTHAVGPNVTDHGGALRSDDDGSPFGAQSTTGDRCVGSEGPRSRTSDPWTRSSSSRHTGEDSHHCVGRAYRLAFHVPPYAYMALSVLIDGQQAGQTNDQRRDSSILTR